MVVVARCLLDALLAEALRLDGDDASVERRGYEAGYRFAERAAQADALPAADPLEAVKFLCKSFWHACFGKQIDKLQTNHRGVFVLKDYSFRWLAHLSHGDEAKLRAAAARLLRFPCGLLKGALANLGLRASVSADPAPPACSFNIRIDSATAVRP
mmetsp:Transcript_13834/g.41184  ORF Transcript_13834/g.41184 Transcript_13834/m.41184 type:complete len:156 (+) Transcript_13834:595-1062(+)